MNLPEQNTRSDRCKEGKWTVKNKGQQMLEERWVGDRSMRCEKEQRSRTWQIPYFQWSQKMTCKRTQTWICDMNRLLNSRGQHLSGTAAAYDLSWPPTGREDVSELHENVWPACLQPGALEAERHHRKGPTVYTGHAHFKYWPAFQVLQVRNLADRIAAFSALGGKLAVACAFSLKAWHSSSVSKHTNLEADFHLWDCIYDIKWKQQHILQKHKLIVCYQ